MTILELRKKSCVFMLYGNFSFFSATTFLSLISRRQELRELRLLQKEEQRAQQQLSNKLQQQKEQIYRRFEQETTVSHSTPKCQSSD